MRTQFKATSIFNMLHFGTKKTHCLHMKIGLSPQPRSKGDSTVEDGHTDQARHKDLPSSYKNLDRCRVGVLDSQSKCQNCGVKDEQGCYGVKFYRDFWYIRMMWITSWVKVIVRRFLVYSYNMNNSWVVNIIPGLLEHSPCTSYQSSSRR
jgi:hypothetical protein